jgi:hypothetical protein
VILLISASRVARIIGIIYWYPAKFNFHPVRVAKIIIVRFGTSEGMEK